MVIPEKIRIVVSIAARNWTSKRAEFVYIAKRGKDGVFG
jgi:hypothetical protein